MKGKIRLLSVVGARPQFVKLAPVARAFKAMGGVTHRIIHTGQHYDAAMSASFFEQLEIPAADVDLGVGSGGHAAQTAAMLTGLEAEIANEAPDAVIVYGDTNSTLAATLAAVKIGVRVAHIEAGLRSFNRAMPEEINRLVADHCGDRLYAPTPQAMRNLEEERLGDRAVLSGDVMLDAVLHNVELAAEKSTALRRHELERGGFAFVTVHRPVNTSPDALQSLLSTLERTAMKHLKLVFPVHPRTRAVLDHLGYQAPEQLLLLDPLPYLDCIALTEAAALVITDSGGVQKEAAFLQTPCLTMRDETEWTETVDIGVNRLVGNAGSDLGAKIEETLAQKNPFNSCVLRSISEHYGCGDAAMFIARDCLTWIGRSGMESLKAERQAKAEV